MDTFWAECFELSKVASHKRNREVGESKLKFYSMYLEPYIATMKTENGRYNYMISQQKSHLNFCLKRWRMAKRIFIGSRGVWANPLELDDHWKLWVKKLLPFIYLLEKQLGYWANHIILFIFLKIGFSQPLFLYFRLFNTVDRKQMFCKKVYRWLDSNCGPVESETTALPTEHQSLLYSVHFVNVFINAEFLYFVKNY